MAILGGRGTAYVTFNYDLFLESALEFAGVPFSYHMPAPPNGVVVLKPHGSVNWYEALPKKIAVSTTGIGTSKMFVASDLLSNAGVVGNPAGFIIPPSPQKSIENEFLRKTWTSFSSVVTNARTVSIVGYSMPAADRLARLVLRRAGQGFANTKHISVINPDAAAHLHFQRFVDPKVQFVGDRFEKFASNVAVHKKMLGLR